MHRISDAVASDHRAYNHRKHLPTPYTAIGKYLPLSRFSFYIIHPLPYIAPAIWDKAGTNAHPRDGVQVQNDAPESENQIVRKVIHRNNGAATYSVFPYRVTALPPHG